MSRTPWPYKSIESLEDIPLFKDCETLSARRHCCLEFSIRVHTLSRSEDRFEESLRPPAPPAEPSEKACTG